MPEQQFISGISCFYYSYMTFSRPSGQGLLSGLNNILLVGTEHLSSPNSSITIRPHHYYIKKCET